MGHSGRWCRYDSSRPDHSHIGPKGLGQAAPLALLRRLGSKRIRGLAAVDDACRAGSRPAFVSLDPNVALNVNVVLNIVMNVVDFVRGRSDAYDPTTTSRAP